MKQKAKQHRPRQQAVRPQTERPGRKKSMVMRILVLVMVIAMFAGFIILPLLQS